MAKRVSTTVESETWRNLKFHDNYSWNDMTRLQFVSQINQWNYSNYHIRVINWIKTPVSNPDATINNNLD
jgi:hypothetical protein